MDLHSKQDPDGVHQAKQRLIRMAHELDPLATVRKHPLISVGVATTLGAVAATPAIEKSILFTKTIDRLVMTAMPLLNQVIAGAREAMQSRTTAPADSRPTDSEAT